MKSALRRLLLSGNVRSPVARFAALGTLRALWHPAYGVTLNGSTVAAWRDLVAGYDYVQATPGAQSTYNATGWAGMPQLEFAGAQYMACAHADWNTFFGGNDTNVVLAGAIDAPADGAVLYTFGVYGATANWIARAKTAVNTTLYVRGGSFFAGAAATGKRHEAVESVGTVGTIYRNGSVLATQEFDVGSLTVTHAAIGTRMTSGSPDATYFIGKMGIIAFYSTVSNHAALSALMTQCGYGHA